MIKQKGIHDYQEMIYEFHFCSYAWISLTCSRSFPHAVASGGLHLL